MLAAVLGVAVAVAGRLLAAFRRLPSGFPGGSEQGR